jgi:hypothetical protein
VINFGGESMVCNHKNKIPLFNDAKNGTAIKLDMDLAFIWSSLECISI